MTGAQLQERMNEMEWDISMVSKLFGKDPSVIRRWLSGAWPVPSPVAYRIELLWRRLGGGPC
jgi:hypothetical protein